METPLFDTRHAADTLVAGGIQQDHANAIVTMLDECLHGTVAKTSDLNEVKAELKADIAEVKAELKADIAEVKAELTTMRSDLEARIVHQANRTILAVIATAGVIVAAIKLF